MVCLHPQRSRFNPLVLTWERLEDFLKVVLFLFFKDKTTLSEPLYYFNYKAILCINEIFQKEFNSITNYKSKWPPLFKSCLLNNYRLYLFFYISDTSVESLQISHAMLKCSLTPKVQPTGKAVFTWDQIKIRLFYLVFHSISERGWLRNITLLYLTLYVLYPHQSEHRIFLIFPSACELNLRGSVSTDPYSTANK